ncbi:hypothetical protein [Sulfuricurvum sp.]
MIKVILIALFALAVNANAYMCKEVFVSDPNGGSRWVTVCN